MLGQILFALVAPAYRGPLVWVFGCTGSYLPAQVTICLSHIITCLLYTIA
jgi:hypothetical protein